MVPNKKISKMKHYFYSFFKYNRYSMLFNFSILKKSAMMEHKEIYLRYN